MNRKNQARSILTLQSNVKYVDCIPSLTIRIYGSINFVFYICNKNISTYSKIYLGFIIFLIMDSYIQLFFGYDIFGFSYNYDYERLTGPFKDEMIIGNYRHLNK